MFEIHRSCGEDMNVIDEYGSKFHVRISRFAPYAYTRGPSALPLLSTAKSPEMKHLSVTKSSRI
jgi:hypothetical protein